MDMDKHPSLLDINQHPSYRELIIDTFCQGIKNTSEFRDCIDYILDKKLYLFTGDEFKGQLYREEDDILELILPAIRRVWGKVYITPPTLLKDKRLELFELLFDIDDFLEYLIDILPKVKNKLELFANLDRTAETLHLIVDNYIAYLFTTAYNMSSNNKSIDKAILVAKRDKKLKKVIND